MIISCINMDSEKVETTDNSPLINEEIRIEIQDQDNAIHNQEGIHTIQLQSPGGSSHFVKGLVVTNSTLENSSTQIHSTIVHGMMVGQHNEIYLPDNTRSVGGITLGDDATGQILQMVRLATDENGETIIYVEPQEPQKIIDGSSHPQIVTCFKQEEEVNVSHYNNRNLLLENEENSSDQQDGSADSDDAGHVHHNTSTTTYRRCVICLRKQKFTEDIFDADRNPYYHISVLLTHLNMQVEANPRDSGVCFECLNHLQRWHIFHSAIVERHNYARNTGSVVVPGPLNFHLLEAQLYKHYTQLLDAKEVFNAATHAHYARRHLTDKDWDFFCDKITLLETIETESENFKELKTFITCQEKLSKYLCTICRHLIPNGRKGYSNHMEKEHNQSPVLYPCDICGDIKPEKVPGSSSSLVDFFEHWISHFQNGKSSLPCSKIINKTTATSPPPINDYEEDSCMEEDVPEKEEKNSGKKLKRGKKAINVSVRRRQRYQDKIKQINNLLRNSSHQHLIRREFDNDSLEYMAERLLSTKSNSSLKMKEIENMTFSEQRLYSIFCDDCRTTILGGKEGYNAHRKLVHKDTDDLTIPCDICGNFYPEKDLSGLSQNYFSHWISHFYFEECGFCEEKFPNANLLKKHSILHEKRPGYPCPQCDKILSKKTTLEQHIRTHLSDEEKKRNALICTICGKSITAPTLKAHMFSVHSDERPWKCEVCAARFKHKSDLNGHRNAVHLKIKNFTCNICGKSFGHQCGLRVHIMSHENKRNHSCSTCGKKFLTLWHLKKHIVTHKEVKDIICNICNKGFKKEESLQEHMTIHTGEMNYECHICGRKVRVLSNLYKHFMVHKKNKTYYSKKDGLPDPLDTYIVEQQKKKSVNKIVLEAKKVKSSRKLSVSKDTTVRLVDSNSSDGAFVTTTTEDSLTNDADIDMNDDSNNILELEKLQVNRSTNRVITYRGRGSRNPKLEKSSTTSSSKSSTNKKNIATTSNLSSPTLVLTTTTHQTRHWPKLGPVIMDIELPTPNNINNLGETIYKS